MHKLQRPAAPQCLSQYRHGQHRWVDVASTDKSTMWQLFDQMQQGRCAYCESAISQAIGQHIEHFFQRRQGARPQLIFDWSNLFGACLNHGYCADHKDQQTLLYDDTHLIKPDIDEPDDFFVFLDDGKVEPKTGLAATDHLRATETIRVFNLNSPSLVGKRAAAVGGQWQTVEELKDMAAEFDEADWRPLYDAELARASTEPFCTAMLHALRF
ncbi:MAG: hypothetical protein RLY58_1385 [Pseudomonadota bacterium]|jgi:uncharacterized protein (TIGR02646 family)